MRSIFILLFVCLLSSCAINQWQPGRYTVAKGDTLYAIAWRYRLDYQQLAQWNNITAPYTIHPGQKIWIGKPSIAIAANEAKASTTYNKPKESKQPIRSTTAPVVARESDTKSKKITWRWPLAKPYTMTKTFKGETSASQGIDLQSRIGVPVYAAADGHVVYSGNGLIGYGNLVIVKHNDTYLSAYALNQKLYVKEGQKVSAGDKIASMGLNADKKPALHFEIRRYGKPVNPIKYLP